METKKMSLANIKGKLSRAEMKRIMAGSGPCPTFCYNTNSGALGSCTQASFGCTCSVGGMC